MRIRGILLDKDGTLLDFDRTWEPVIRHLAESFCDPAQADDMVERAGYDPATGRFRAGSVWAAGATPDLVRLWWPRATPEERQGLAARIDAVCADMAPRIAVPLCDLEDFFCGLSGRGLEVGIATNDSAASLAAFTRIQGLEGRVRHLFGYDSVANPKPAPDMVHSFATACGLATNEVAVVGDNTHDLEMARAAGAVSVGVLSGTGTRTDLAPLADVVLEGIAGLADWLERVSQAQDGEHVL